MKKFALASLFVLGLLASHLHVVAEDVCGMSDSFKEVAVGGKPESVLLHNDLVLASNMGEGARTQKGDGYISRLSTDGRVIERKWLPLNAEELDSPLGMAVVGRTLYVADVNRIAIFNLDTREAMPAIDLSSTGASFLNDVVAGDAPYIYVSATALKRIFRVNTQTGEFVSIAQGLSELKVPNGLAWSSEKHHLYIAQNNEHSIPQDGLANGNVLILDAANDYKVVNSSSAFGQFIDGIAVTAEGKILVSDWHSFSEAGQLHRLDMHLDVSSKVSFASNGFADFAADPEGRCVIAPDLMTGQVIFAKR